MLTFLRTVRYTALCACNNVWLIFPWVQINCYLGCNNTSENHFILCPFFCLVDIYTDGAFGSGRGLVFSCLFIQFYGCKMDQCFIESRQYVYRHFHWSLSVVPSMLFEIIAYTKWDDGAIMEAAISRNTAAQGYFRTQNYTDGEGQEVIMDECCSWCLEPFDKFNRVSAGTWAAVCQM